MRVITDVRIRLEGLTRFGRSIRKRNEKVYKQWAVIYRSFVQRRFNKFSRGGGDWPPLKTRRGSILRDTGTLFAAMAPMLTPPRGSINKMLKDGIEVGFGGNETHPGGPTIHQIAVWHQTGAPPNPQRQIIVEPDERTMNQMVAAMERAYAQDSV